MPLLSQKVKGEYMGVSATGNTVSTKETGIMRFKEGKIVEFWGTFDDYSLSSQIGLINTND